MSGSVFACGSGRQRCVQVSSLRQHKMVTAAATSTASFVVTDEGDLYVWGTGGAVLGLGTSDAEAYQPVKIPVRNRLLVEHPLSNLPYPIPRTPVCSPRLSPSSSAVVPTSEAK